MPEFFGQVVPLIADTLIRDLIRRWQAEEERLGLEIDPRVFAFIATSLPQFQVSLAAFGNFPHQDPFWRFQVISGLLWPRGFHIRSQGLSFYNPFAEPPPPDREILLDLLQVRRRLPSDLALRGFRKSNRPLVAVGQCGCPQRQQISAP